MPQRLVEVDGESYWIGFEDPWSEELDSRGVKHAADAGRTASPPVDVSGRADPYTTR